MKWVIAQKWSHVLFLHYEICPKYLQNLLPDGLEVDLYEEKSYISIVPFYMSHIRFPVTPAFPFISLWELNLRTYVKRNGVAGIYFFTLDTHDLLGEFIANRFFHLPYRYRQMNGSIESDIYTFKATNQISLKAKISETQVKGKLLDWLSERYCLFTMNKGKQFFRGDVIHDKWKLQEVDSLKLENNFTQEFGFNLLKQPDVVCYAKEIDVKFRPFVKV